MAIFFHDDNLISGLNNKKNIKLWMRSVLNAENKKEGIINVVLTTDKELRELNQKFLSRDYYTDIITFDYSEGGVLSGDLFISLERVRENADTFRSAIQDELRRVMVHGILHLIGYGDQSEQEIKDMRSLEDKYLKEFPESH